MTWDPAVYGEFAQEREAPFEDLLALINVRPGMRVIDLGCGSGALTSRLATVLPRSDVLGIDVSSEMLAAAPAARPGLRFERRRIEDVYGTFDLVFSHSALQWLDSHETLMPRLYAMVDAGGQLAVQIPANHDHPAHALLGDIASEAPFADALGGWRRTSPVLSIERYAEVLWDIGATDIVVMERVYPLVLEDAASLFRWARGTAMTAYLPRLPEDLRESFENRYAERLRMRYPAGRLFYAFKRILVAATNRA